MQSEQIDSQILAASTNFTLPQILAERAVILGTDHTAIREKAYGIWQTYNWYDYYQMVKKVGMGIKSLGFRRGDNAGIITDNHSEWLFSELGIQSVGGISVNLFTSAVSSELAHTLNRIQATFVFAQDQEQVDKLIDEREKLSHVERVIYIDPTGMRSYRDNPWLMSFKELLEKGERFDECSPGLFAEEVDRGSPNDISVMIMTSGTTGLSKLAMLSHKNFSEMAISWLEATPLSLKTNWLSLSPPPWIVDQMWGVGVALVGGMPMNFPETPETIMADFRELGPSTMISSSRFWEDLASQIRVKISDAGFIKRKLFAISEKIGNAVVSLQVKKKTIPFHLRLLQRIASLLVFRALLDRVGCARLVSAYTGGHPISPDVIKFFRSAGLNLKQCYGLTEAGGIFQIQPDDEVKAETVGKPLPRTDVKLSSEQEVLVSSGAVFRGYYNDYKATEAAFDGGWLKTGDAGYFDEDGHLVIIGRKEEIIRNKEGEAFSPDFIETRLKFSPYISEVVIFGEGRPYLTAFINIDMGNVGNWAEDHMIPYTTYTDLSQQSEVKKLILSEVRQVNKALPDPMKIRKFILLYKMLDADDEELTRTGKVRRRFVYGLYINLIQAMYENKETVAVKTKIRYRDGQMNTIETTVEIINTKQGE